MSATIYKSHQIKGFSMVILCIMEIYLYHLHPSIYLIIVILIQNAAVVLFLFLNIDVFIINI